MQQQQTFGIALLKSSRHKTDKIINKTPLAYWIDENWTIPHHLIMIIIIVFISFVKYIEEEKEDRKSE